MLILLQVAFYVKTTPHLTWRRCWFPRVRISLRATRGLGGWKFAPQSKRGLGAFRRGRWCWEFGPSTVFPDRLLACSMICACMMWEWRLSEWFNDWHLPAIYGIIRFRVDRLIHNSVRQLNWFGSLFIDPASYYFERTITHARTALVPANVCTLLQLVLFALNKPRCNCMIMPACTLDPRDFFGAVYRSALCTLAWSRI